jgi:hypothetical protein
MQNGVANDVCRVEVSKFVNDLSPAAACLNQPRATENTKVLTDQRLGHTNRVDEFMHAVRVVGEQVDDGQSNRGGERS